MYWRVQSQRDDGTVLTAHVEFWANESIMQLGEPPIHLEEFIVSRPMRVFNQIVTDASFRYLCADGQYVWPWIEVDGEWQGVPEDPANPWVREDVALDMQQELIDVVERYIERTF